MVTFTFMRLTTGCKKLRKFLEQHGITKTDAGRALGVTHAAVIAWLKGTSVPGQRSREAIETWTSGEIVANDWLTAKERAAQPVDPYDPEAGAA